MVCANNIYCVRVVRGSEQRGGSEEMLSFLGGKEGAGQEGGGGAEVRKVSLPWVEK